MTIIDETLDDVVDIAEEISDAINTETEGEASTSTSTISTIASASTEFESEIIVADPAIVAGVAKVRGETLLELPSDLYIPPDALEVILETFEGPLDLLLYLIRRQNLDILDIPIAAITEQYMVYVEMMKSVKLELAAEYLVMAALLAEIKSRLLLPKSPLAEEDEADPRKELVRRLQEYEQFKQAAEAMDMLPRVGRDIFMVSADLPELHVDRPHPDVSMKELLIAFSDVLKRMEVTRHHHIQQEPLSIRERMTTVLEKLHSNAYLDFSALFTFNEGRLGVVVTFIAVLELVKQSMIEVVQASPLAAIHVKAKESTTEVDMTAVEEY